MNAMNAKIAVTGAGGGLGGEVVAQLLRVAPGALFAVSTRNPEAVSGLREKDVQVRHGDFDFPETLDDAFRGADRLLIISTRGGNEARVRQHRNALEAARRVGVGHIYYTSIVQREGSVFLPADGHIETERDLKLSGLTYTTFRNGNYIENLPMFLGFGLHGNVLALPPDGPTAWVARSDLAEGIARVMIQGDHAGKTLLLTGPEALDFGDIAGLLRGESGETVERRFINGDEFVRQLEDRGLATEIARMFESGFRSRAAGELAQVDPTLAQILGRRLRTGAEVLPGLLKAEVLA
jgi:uncharacterized protein YbjT (DUF2867 family)